MWTPFSKKAGPRSIVAQMFALVFLVSLVPLAIEHLLYELPLIGIDDANIFFVYAKNLANGEGFVYNAGGERVEGATSLLYTIICACAFAVSRHAEILIQVINCVMCAIGLTSLVWLLGLVRSETDGGVERARVGMGWASVFLLGWALTSPGFMSYMQVTLMDSALWMMVLAVTLTMILRQAFRGAPSSRDTIAFSIGLAVAVLTRPEALVLGPAFLACWFIVMLSQERGPKAAMRSSVVPAVAVFSSMGGLTLFRLIYFGFPLPNTYYAKVSPDIGYRLSGGLAYFLQFLASNPLVWGVVLLSAVGSVALLRRVLRLLAVRDYDGDRTPPDRTPPDRRPPDRTPEDRVALCFQVSSAVALLSVLIQINSGGDHFPLFRAFQSTWPIFGLVPIFLVMFLRIRGVGARAWQSISRNRWPAGAAVLLLLYVANNPRWDNVVATEMPSAFKWAHQGRRRGEMMNQVCERTGPLVASNTLAGGFGFQYRGTAFDVLGLNHVAMGHSPGDRKGAHGFAAFDVDVFWTVEPDVVQPSFEFNVEMFDMARMHALPELQQDPRFHELYTPCLVTRPDGSMLSDPWFFYPRIVLRYLGHRMPKYLNSGLSMYCKRDVIEKLRGAGYEVQL